MRENVLKKSANIFDWEDMVDNPTADNDEQKHVEITSRKWLTGKIKSMAHPDTGEVTLILI